MFHMKTLLHIASGPIEGYPQKRNGNMPQELKKKIIYSLGVIVLMIYIPMLIHGKGIFLYRTHKKMVMKDYHL